MNENHRRLINTNIDRLVEETVYEVMKNACLEREVLTQTMVDIIEQDAADDADRNTLLFRKLTHRGPKAFQNILQILKDKHYDEAHKLLSVSIIPSATFSNEDVDFEENTLSIGNTKNIIRSTSTTTSSNYNNNNNSINIEDSPAQEPVTSIDGLFSSKPKTLKLKPYTKKTSFHFDSDVEVKRAANYGSHPKLQVYPMKSKKRGVFFFVNIINFTSDKAKREGAERDKENLVTLFSEMNYTVFYYEDLKRHEFFDLLGQLLKSDFIKCIDSFVFCIQTHGDMYQNQTIMEFSDGLSERIERIISLFSNKECEDLALKPKVFFFPFCRGKIADKEKKIAFSRIESDGNANMVPSFSDILICYGTVPGFVTHRDTNYGSWYVRELCKIFAEHACDCHVEDLLKMVGSKTLEIRDAGSLQVASTENRGFNKLLFFNPKISD